MRDLVSGIVGIVLLAAFLGIMLWWIKSIPLTVIAVLGFAAMLYDFVQTMRAGGANGTS